jgi:UDP-N-acetylmuramate dehydrogenase
MELRGTVRLNEPLINYNSWRIGGPAKQLYQPADREDLIYFLRSLSPKEKILWIGLGSNLLIRDTGFDGTVIITQGSLNEIKQLDDNIVNIEAGVACGTVARFCARRGLTGIEFLAGVPGTMGGALAMNAGAHGGETWQFVTQCETIDRYGNTSIRPASDYDVGYRYVKHPKEEWFLAGQLTLIPGNAEQSLAKIKSLLEHRLATQPINLPNCGSVFRNPPNNFAAKLIESCGLKGKRIGGAAVSTKHANFIINDQNASAADIESLINLVAENVEQQHGIKLIREVHVVGK